MWADTLLQLERAHLLRLLVWGVSSVIAGTTALAWLAWRREHAPMLRHFALQCAAWGLVLAGVAVIGWQTVTLRDFAGMQRLVNVLWFSAGLGLGFVAVGATVIVMGWKPVRRAGAVGAGFGIVVQGIAAVLFHLRLIGGIGPVQ